MIQIAILYALFAAVAMGANLGSQALVFTFYLGRWQLLVALVIGTGVGLLVKYVLDKRWIFKFRTDGVAHDTRLFILYSAMGLLTTVIFWGVEYAFDRAFGTEVMRYVGGAIGLIVGYVIKYRLDKLFVFKR